MKTQYLKINQGKIAYDDQGEGPLVICVPSLGDTRQEYRFLAPTLVEAGYRVVTMDSRGHGESSTGWDDYSVGAVGADILALIQHLEAGPALIIGTSMAGGAAVWADAESPEAVRAMVLINPFVRDTRPTWQSKLLFTPLFSGPWAQSAWISYFKTLYPTNPPEDFPKYLEDLRRNLSEPGRMAAVRAMITSSKKASAERLGQATAPTLIIMGSKDPDFKEPKAEAGLISENLAGRAEINVIDGAGHYPQAEMPEKTAQIILNFIASPVKEATNVP